MPRHILYVAWGFPPHRGPGTYRPLATVNELARRGYQVTVLTADLDTFDVVFGADHSLLRNLDSRVEIVRVPFRPVLQDPLLDRWPPARMADPITWREETTRALAAQIPDPAYAPWLGPAVSAAVQVHGNHPVDLTIATGNPYVDFAVAWSLNVDDAVPYVLDDRDSWMHDVYTGELQPDADAVRTWLAPAVEAATQLWFVNPPIADAYRTEFPEATGKIRVVENGWDPNFVGGGVERRPRGPHALTAAFIGTLSPNLPLRTLAEAWRQARASSVALAGAQFRLVGQLGHNGVGNEEQKAVRAEYAGDGVILAGRVPKAEVAQAYAEADFLVFAKEGGGLVTSGKIYEYVASGLPIASLIEREHDARRVLAAYPRWHDAEEPHVEALARAVVSAAEDALGDGGVRRAAVQYAQQFRRDNVLSRALDDLERELGW